MWWLVLAYLVLEFGEMCLSPVGLSAVTQLSVPRVVSLMMAPGSSARPLETLAALFGKLAALEILEGAALDFAEAGAGHGHLFWVLLWIGLPAAPSFAPAPLLRRWMHEG